MALVHWKVKRTQACTTSRWQSGKFRWPDVTDSHGRGRSRTVRKALSARPNGTEAIDIQLSYTTTIRRVPTLQALETCAYCFVGSHSAFMVVQGGSFTSATGVPVPIRLYLSGNRSPFDAGIRRSQHDGRRGVRPFVSKRSYMVALTGGCVKDTLLQN